MTLGLVLSGGAARGAYEAGVMRFLFVDLARQLGHPTWPQVVSGTSVGALNGVFAVAQDRERLGELSRIWREMKIADIYELRIGRLLELLKRDPAQDFAVLDPTPLRSLMASMFPRAEMRRALDSGACHTFVVAATELATGFNTLFVDGRGVGLSEKRPVPGMRVCRTAITEVHCRASAALPFLFPAVLVDGRWHVDGGLRQNTPLRPAIHAGANRVLVVGLKQTREEEGAAPLANATPNLAFLMGKMLNALMLDPVERDVRQADQVNDILALGDDAMRARASEVLGIRPVDTMFINPSTDLGRLASAQFRENPPATSRWLRRALDFFADHGNEEADLLSYLYFDRGFTATIEELGWEDARRQEEQLARFVSPASFPAPSGIG